MCMLGSKLHELLDACRVSDAAMRSDMHRQGMLRAHAVGCRSAYREPSFGEKTLEVYNATHAQWTWHRNQDGAQQVADQVVLVRDPGACKNRAGASAAPSPRSGGAYGG
jgi:hypothetical protein